MAVKFGNIFDIEKVKEDSTKYVIMTVSSYQLLMLNAIARGEVAENAEDADVVFKKIDKDNVLALADILANYL